MKTALHVSSEDQIVDEVLDFSNLGLSPKVLSAVEDAGYTIFAPPQQPEEPPTSPAIIAETRVDIPDATVSDAVMMLDLRNTNALMFKNMKSGALNMVYRRDDGTIGWVEPRTE